MKQAILISRNEKNNLLKILTPFFLAVILMLSCLNVQAAQNKNKTVYQFYTIALSKQYGSATSTTPDAYVHSISHFEANSPSALPNHWIWSGDYSYKKQSKKTFSNVWDSSCSFNPYCTSIKNLKSSNKKVVKVKVADKANGTWGKQVQLTSVGKGTATVTYDVVEFFPGKPELVVSTTHYVVKVAVIEHKNPLATLKIGKTDLTKQFTVRNKFMHYLDFGIKQLSGKLNIKAASGWKISQIKYVNYDGTEKILKNGNKVSLNLSSKMVILMRNTKYGYYEPLVVEIMSKGGFWYIP